MKSFLSPRKVDATTGVIWKQLFIYIIPLIISYLIQNCFNAIDLIVLGNLADSSSIASVGATGSIISLMILTFLGIGGGCKIILSHHFGSKDSEMIKKATDTSLITAAVIGVFVGVLSFPLAPLLLQLTNCPPDCFEGAVLYIRIYVGSAPAIMIYNFGGAVLIASGDSQRPLYYIIIGGLTNICLNILLCLILPQKVAAVAVATAASQIIAAILVVRRLCTMEGDGKLVFSTLSFDMETFRQILKQGIPLMINSIIYPFTNIQIQSAINTFGVSAIAGVSASVSISGLPGAFSDSFSSTNTVFIGQNLGAKNEKRAKKVLRTTLLLNSSIGFFFGIFLCLTGRTWLKIFLPDDPIGIEYGMLRTYYVLGFHAIVCINSMLGTAIQCYGYPLFTTLSNLVWACGLRVFWMQIIYPRYQTFPMLMVCYPITYGFILITYIFAYSYFSKRIRSIARTKK